MNDSERDALAGLFRHAAVEPGHDCPGLARPRAGLGERVAVGINEGGSVAHLAAASGSPGPSSTLVMAVVQVRRDHGRRALLDGDGHVMGELALGDEAPVVVQLAVEGLGRVGGARDLLPLRLGMRMLLEVGGAEDWLVGRPAPRRSASRVYSDSATVSRPLAPRRPARL